MSTPDSKNFVSCFNSYHSNHNANLNSQHVKMKSENTLLECDLSSISEDSTHISLQQILNIAQNEYDLKINNIKECFDMKQNFISNYCLVKIKEIEYKLSLETYNINELCKEIYLK